MTNERKALVAFATFTEGKTYINIGPGDHSCDKWEISDQQAKLLLVDLARRILTERLYSETPDRY